MDKDELIVADWIKFAQEDLNAASMLADVPYIVPACYHCQQCVEKILKAYIIVKERILIKTHDLLFLIKECEKYSPDFSKFKDICSEITLYTAIRYPVNRKLRNLTVQDMRQALKDTRDLFEFTESKLKELGYESDNNNR
jgi:HEPN domain-containing protein